MDNYIYTFHLASSRLKPDGTAEIFPDPAVFVDINGVNKPNLLGKDIFLLDRFSDGNGIQPRCHNNSNSYVDVNCSKNNSRTNVDCCAEKIRRAGWVIDKSYPWH